MRQELFWPSLRILHMRIYTQFVMLGLSQQLSEVETRALIELVNFPSRVILEKAVSMALYYSQDRIWAVTLAATAR